MSGGLYPRIKTWSPTDTIIGSDLNAEFDNVLNYFMAQYMDDYSATVNQMRVQTDPGESGTESQATSLAGELERIRFALAEIKGTSYWYESATSSINQLVNAIGTNILANRVSSGRMSTGSSQPLFLVPNGAAATVTLKGATTPFVYSIRGTQYTISTDVSVTGLTTAPSSNNTCILNDATLANAFSKLVGENGTQITVTTMGSEITGLTGKMAAFKTAGGEYFIARVESSTALTKAMRGYFFNSADAIVPRGTIANSGTVTLMKLTWIFAKADGTLGVSYTNPRYAASAPTSPAIGDYWYDTTSTVNYWKIYNGTSWLEATATLVGSCIQDGSNCVGARSFDFFHNFSDLNSIELIYESATEIRSRYRGSQLSVYGTQLGWDQDFLRWNTSTDFDSGLVEAASTYYYAYVKESGAFVLSDVAPYDMRGLRRGYYHPVETWRCVGYVRNDGSSNFQTDVESFFQTNEWRNVGALTAAVTSYPLPYNVTPKVRTFTFDGTAGALNQTILPAAQTRGEILRFIRTDNTPANIVTLTCFGSDTINGASSYVLYTQNESLAIVAVSNTAYVVVDHYARTTHMGPAVLVVGATTTAPTKGTTSTDAVLWSRNGKFAEIEVHYAQSATGANSGSGEYIFTLPGSIVIDTTYHPTITTTGLALDSQVAWVSSLPIYMWLGRTGGATYVANTAAALPYSTTQYRILMSVAFGGGTSGAWGSATALGFASAMAAYWKITVPVSGWQP